MDSLGQFASFGGEILHILQILQSLRKDIITDEFVQKVINFMVELKEYTPVSDISNLSRPEIQPPTDNVQENDGIIPLSLPPPVKIVDVPDKTIKLCYLRNVDMSELTHTDTCIEYKKSKYQFNGVYLDDSIIPQMVVFINERLEAGKDTSIILYAYSGSGKSHMTKNLILMLNASIYSVYGIYNNQKIGDGKRLNMPCESFVKHLDKICMKSPTKANPDSSRSHTIITMHFGDRFVQILDLCGNEKPAKSGIFTKQDAESRYINESLYSVTQYIKAPSKYKNNKCLLYQALKTTKNMLLCMIMNDNETARLKATNHLLLFRDVLRK